MENPFTVPEELREAFQRLLPYMPPAIRADREALESLVLYLKLGGDKLARAAIDAYNQTHRLKTAQLQKLRIEEALLAERLDDEDDDDEDDEDDDDDEMDDEDSDEEY